METKYCGKLLQVMIGEDNLQLDCEHHSLIAPLYLEKHLQVGDIVDFFHQEDEVYGDATIITVNGVDLRVNDPREAYVCATWAD
jgi:hypothetical protein